MSCRRAARAMRVRVIVRSHSASILARNVAASARRRSRARGRSSRSKERARSASSPHLRRDSHPRRRRDCRTHVGAGTDLRTSAQASALQESCAKLQKRIDRRAA